VLLVVGIGLSVAAAQEAREVLVRANGQLLARDAEGDFATVEINLHNSNWTYASQADATAASEDLAGGGKRLTGTLPVPEVIGAALSFLQTITPADDGLHIIYELQPAGPLVLNGLQISVVLPAERFGGQQVIVRHAEAIDRTVPLPRALNPAQWQLGTIQGNAVQIGADEATALTAKISKTYGLILNDLRRWDRDEFEIRIPLIYEEQGRMLSTTDRFSVELVLGPGELALTGP
jgi:hypothetical protein